jgi:site-specific DNA recombinase
MNIGLIRVSSIGQKDNTSLENQKKMINEYCSIYSIELDDIIEEVYTGTTSDRDCLNYLKSLIEKGSVESVVVMKLDRLMRSFSEGVVFIKYLLDNDVKIISVLEKIDTSTTSGRFFMNVLLSLNEMERDTIVDRMNTGKLRKFENHERVSGTISYGYKKSENSLIVDKEVSKIIHYIYKR